jgi:hypothetical protein
VNNIDALKAIIAKKPDDLTAEERDALFLVCGYLNDEELSRFTDVLPTLDDLTRQIIKPGEKRPTYEIYDVCAAVKARVDGKPEGSLVRPDFLERWRAGLALRLEFLGRR